MAGILWTVRARFCWGSYRHPNLPCWDMKDAVFGIKNIRHKNTPPVITGYLFPIRNGLDIIEYGSAL